MGNNYSLQYPTGIKKQFYWRTTPVNKTKMSVFKTEFVQTNYLNAKQDYSAYQSYFTNRAITTDNSIVAFPNLSGDTILIVPIPVKGKKFTYIKDFIDNSSLKLQHSLWRRVAKEAKKLLKKHNRIWLSTHGEGIPYLHIRLDTKPKYYGKSKLQNIVHSKLRSTLKSKKSKKPKSKKLKKSKKSKSKK